MEGHSATPPDPALPGAPAEGQWPPGWTVRYVAETASTNADLLLAGAAGAPDRTVLAAGHQTAGRGRLDRRWEAPPGANLLVSILLRSVPARPQELTQRVALAAALATERLSGVRVELKWPNDLLVGERKLAGVLAELGRSGPADSRRTFVVVGLGLNVAWAPEGAACLGDGFVALDVLRALLAELDELDSLTTGIGAAYRERLATVGKEVRVVLPGEAEPIVGTAVSVEADGRLVVLDTLGVTHWVATGDVVHLRHA
ncbi:MAG: biotin--[acetyl-CoA-carboxylase] ligase [Actinomycetota bacterium]|nr:MAG: biotin--[acetyl-CoA-carboxylase] ligase [Actinomycetota bacterium]